MTKQRPCSQCGDPADGTFGALCAACVGAPPPQRLSAAGQPMCKAPTCNNPAEVDPNGKPYPHCAGHGRGDWRGLAAAPPSTRNASRAADIRANYLDQFLACEPGTVAVIEPVPEQRPLLERQRKALGLV